MGAFDDLIPKGAGGAFDDLIPAKPVASGPSAAQTALSLGLSYPKGAAETLSGVGKFMQAPVATTNALWDGGAVALNRGAVWLANKARPWDFKPDADLEAQAQQSSRDAAVQREANLRVGDASWAAWLNPRTLAARFGLGLERDMAKNAEAIGQVRSELTPDVERAARAISDAEGVVGTAKAIADNPAGMVPALGESLFAMLVGAGFSAGSARAVTAGAAKQAEIAAARATAAGGDGAVAAKAVMDEAAQRAVRVASGTGVAAEGGFAGIQDQAQTGRQVEAMPIATLEAQSPRFLALLAETGNAEKARTRLANEIADQSAGITLLGTAVGSRATKRLFGKDTTARVLSGTEKTTFKDALKNTAQEGVEEVLQGVPQDLAQHGAMLQADPNHKLDLGGSAVQNFVAGAAMGGPSTAGKVAWDKAQELRGGQAGNTTAPPPGAPSPAPGASPAPAPAAVPEPTEAEKALLEPRNLTSLDRVQEIETEAGRLRERLAELNRPDAGYGPMFDQERADVGAQAVLLDQERAALSKDWPTLTGGAQTTFTTEAGARVEARYALVEASGLQTSHDEGLRKNPAYPQELQPRERDRAASELQVSGIVQKLDPARLGLSADAANGAPIIGADGLVESGNARTIALKRVYRVPGQKAGQYKAWLRENAAQFGLTPEAVDAMEWPVLVRVRQTPVNRAEFARQANASTVAAMSPSEQARSDANRIDSMEDLAPDDNGDFSGARSQEFISRFRARLPVTEQAGMMDGAGRLSAAGYTRVRNAVLAKAYGDSPVLARMTESLDDNLRNVSKALLIAAPRVAQMREAVQAGSRFDADITPELLAAVEELSRIKEGGGSVADALAQAGLLGDAYSPETREILQFLADNIRRPRRIADFIAASIEALDAAGDPNQGSMFGDTQAPAKSDLISAARRAIDEQASNSRDAQRRDAGEGASAGAQAGGEPQAAPVNRGGDQGDGAASADPAFFRGQAGPEWVEFPEEFGSLNIPRAQMPQLRGDARGALVGFLKARGIESETVEVPADSLSPTQLEFSPAKARRWQKIKEGSDRSVLIASDGHILDGHHQWLGALAAGERVKAIRFDAPIRELLAAVAEFPSAQRGEGAATAPAAAPKPDARTANRQAFKDAMGDLAQILSKHTRASMVPEQTPGLLPTLVQLFEAGIKEVGYSMRDLLAYVKGQIKQDARFKTTWNKISQDTFTKAARQALENLERGGAGEPGELIVDGHAYDLDAPNFGADPWPRTLPDDSPLLRETIKLSDQSAVTYGGESMTRAQMRQKIIDAHFAGLTPAPQDRKPVVYVMAGGGASGKGTIKKRLIADGRIQASGTVNIDPDEIKSSHLPEYQQIVEAGDSRAAAVVHEESSSIAAAVRGRAVAGRFDLVLDVTLGDKQKGEKLLRDLKSAGYEVRLFGVTTDPVTSVVRAIKRAKGSGRYVPIGHLLAAHKGFNEAFAGYADIADQAALFENIGDTPKTLATAEGGGALKTENGYNVVAERSALNERAKTLRDVGPGSKQGAQGDESGRGDGVQGRDRQTGQQVAGQAGQDASGAGNAGLLLRGRGLGGEADRAGGAGQGAHGGAEGGLDANRKTRQAGASGEGAGAVPGSAQERGTGGVRAGDGQRNLFADLDAGAGDRQAARVREAAGVRPDEGGRGDEHGAGAGAGGSVRDGAGVSAGRPGGRSAGRDIPPKSGLNYRFADDDLTYEGSWAVKAEQNVAAVELLKRLEAEGRERINEARAQMDALSTRLEAPFPMAAMLADKVRDAQDLRAELEAAGKEKDKAAEDDAAVAVVFNRSGSGPGAKLAPGTLPRVTKVAQAIRSAWANPPPLVVLENMDDPRVPPEVRQADQAQRSQGATGSPAGFYFRGTAYLVASELQTDAEVARVLAHEVLGHYGLRSLYGDALDGILTQLWQARPELVSAKAAAYGQDTTTKRGRLVAAEEVLAEMAETTPELGFVRRAVAAIRSWLRANVPALKGLALTDDEIIRNWILPARGFVMRGHRRGADREGVAAMSRTDATKAGYEARIDALFGGAKASLAGVRVLDRSELLGLLGYADKPVTLAEGKVLQGQQNHAAMTAEIWKKIPDWLDAPAAVFASDTVDGRLVFIAPELVGGSVAMLVVEPSADGLKAHLLLNAYNKDGGPPPMARWARDGLTRYIDQKEFPAILGASGLQLPGTAFQNKPGTGRILTQKNLAGYKRATADGAFSRTGAESGAGEKTRVQQLKDRVVELTGIDSMASLIYVWQDKLIDLKQIRDRIQALGGTVNDLNDAYQAEELYHKRVAKRTEDFLAQELKPLLAQLRAQAVSIEDFERYLHARHAPEANAAMAARNPSAAMIAQGLKDAGAVVKALELDLQSATASGAATRAIEASLNEARGELTRWKSAQPYEGSEADRQALSGMSNEDAKAVMAALSAERRQKMEALADRVDAMNRKTLDTLEDYGLMSKVSLQAWRDEYKFYVPLHRDEAHPDSVSHPIGQGFSVRGDAAKRRTGSTAKVTNILAHVAMQRESALTRGEKNTVTKRLFIMVAQNPDKDLWEIGKVPTLETINKDTGFVQSTPDPTFKNKPNVIVLRVAGKDEAIIFNERNPQAVRLAGALKNLDATDLGAVAGFVSRFTRWFSAVNTQYNPVFGLVNFARDVQAGLLNLSTTPLAGREAAVAKAVPGAMRAIYRTQRGKGAAHADGAKWAALWEDMQDAGGTTGYRDMFADAADRADALVKELNVLERGQASQAAHAVLDWLSDYNEAIENSVRLAAYKVALDQGLSRMKAASLAKNITVNFNRKGANTRQVGAWYAFFNAAIQGSVRMLETLRGPTGKKIMYGGVALGFFTSMLGMLVMGANDDGEDEWEGIPDFVKERSVVIPTGRKTYVAIPLPLGFHIFPNMGRLMAEAVMGDATKTPAKQIGKALMSLASAFNPIGGGGTFMQQFAPTVFDPMLALAENKDWTGRPIYMEDRDSKNPSPGHERVKDSASGPSRAVAQAINSITGGTQYRPGWFSPTPDQLDYVVGQITGGVGREALKLEQFITSPVTGLEVPAHKIPVLGRFRGNTEGAGAQSGRFYDNLKEINGIEREIKGRYRDGGDVAEVYREEPLANLVGQANGAEKYTAMLRKQRTDVVKKGLPGFQARSKEIDGELEARMREFNRAVVKAREGAGR